MANVIFRQGDTTTISMTLSEPLGDKKLKVGLYKSGGAPFYEYTYPDDGVIQKIDNTHYMLTINYEESMNIVGSVTLRATVYTADKSLVNSGENVISMIWDKEPVNKNLK